MASSTIAQSLCTLFNACIIHGYVPESFISSDILPVEKDKMFDRSSFDKYRPISYVTVFPKFLRIAQQID